MIREYYTYSKNVLTSFTLAWVETVIFKSSTGSGSVGEGEPPSKPDVTVSVNKENFLKVLNAPVLRIRFILDARIRPY